MKTIYILTMILGGGSGGSTPAIVTQEYNNQGTCEQAAASFLSVTEGYFYNNIAYCEPK